jgi:hypothetical protein
MSPDPVVVHQEILDGHGTRRPRLLVESSAMPRARRCTNRQGADTNELDARADRTWV